MKFAGQPLHEIQAEVAGAPGGQTLRETPKQPAARRKTKTAGQRALETQPPRARNGADRGQPTSETQVSIAADRATIDTLIEVGRRDSFAIRQRMRIRQATLSHIARAEYGYHAHQTESERKLAMDAATKLVKSMRAGQDHTLSTLVHATDAAAAPWEDIQRQSEKVMVKLARQLPAYAWVQGVRGFGDLSFARIIAETGDLSGYDNPAKVWKRLGLAVFDGRAQRRTRDAEKAVEQGYSPRRRSVSWVSFHSVYLAQSARKESGGQDYSETHVGDAAGDDDGAGQGAIETQTTSAGHYRLLYDTKKAEYLERVAAGEAGWTKFRADRAAKRYAEKRLLRDLWVAWNHDAGQRLLETQKVAAGDGDRGGHHGRDAQMDRAAPVTAND